MDVKETAVRLRKQGLTYKEVSSALNGAISVDWCKRNLKGVLPPRETPNATNNDALGGVIALASRPEGCTNYEMKGVLMQWHTEDDMKGGVLMKNYKKRALYQNKDCLFRPAWLSCSDVSASHRYMYALANDMYERLQEAVDDYTNNFPDTNRSVVLHELLLLSHGKLNPEGLERHIEKNNEVVSALIDRLTPCT